MVSDGKRLFFCGFPSAPSAPAVSLSNRGSCRRSRISRGSTPVFVFEKQRQFGSNSPGAPGAESAETRNKRVTFSTPNWRTIPCPWPGFLHRANGLALDGSTIEKPQLGREQIFARRLVSRPVTTGVCEPLSGGRAGKAFFAKGCVPLDSHGGTPNARRISHVLFCRAAVTSPRSVCY